MSKSSLRAKAIPGLSFGGKGNSGLAETTGDNREWKMRQIGPKEGNWVCNPDGAGFKTEIPVKLRGGNR
jgi:hypothetical protein